MTKTIALLLSILLSTTLLAMSKKPVKMDDWDYNATLEGPHKKSRLMPTLAGTMLKESIGFSVGGAKDANNFYENIAQGYLPAQNAITYEGVFYDHYFKSPASQSCETLFCPNYQSAISKNPFTAQKEYFLSIHLDSNIEEKDFKRKKLNIVVVLDISGSMGSAFDQYYYDKNQKISLGERERKESKMTLANKAIVSMIDHLKDEDRLGVVLFDNQAYNAKPLRTIHETDIESTKKHILALRERGGTNWSKGYKAGVSLFDSLDDSLKDPAMYENRIIFLTDAMPNRGELKEEGLFSLAQNASKKKIYTTFIGIGVDFNNDLVEAVTKTRGANYYAIHSSKEFQKRLDDEFDFMVTPLVFDLKLKLLSKNFKITAVYGSPEASRATGDLMVVNTLFPSQSDDNGTRGGVILLKLQPQRVNQDITLEVSYHDRLGKLYTSRKNASFKEGLYHESKSIQKAILLSRYVDLMKNFTLDMRKSCHDSSVYPFETLKQTCALYPKDRKNFHSFGQWEQKSCPLIVSSGYQKIFSLFNQHFKSQMKEITDNTLTKEQTLLEDLIHKSTKKDDWVSKR